MAGITTGSPAANAGLAVGDVIVEVGQKQIHDLQDIRKIGTTEISHKKTVRLVALSLVLGGLILSAHSGSSRSTGSSGT